MKVSYRFQADEAFYVTSHERYLRQRLFFRCVQVVIKFGFVALVLVAIATAYQQAWLLMFASMTFVIAILFQHRIDRFIVKWKIRKSPYLNMDCLWEFSDSEINTSGTIITSKIAWEYFTHAVRFADGILLFSGHGMFFWLPNSALVEGSTPEQAESLIREHVPGYRQIE